MGCNFYGTTGIIMQLLLGFVAYAILIIKRYTEKPKRQWKIWFLDSSKQVISQLFGHFLNVIFSQILSDEEKDDPCNWYFVTIFLDTTAGNLKSGNYITIINQYNQYGDDKIQSNNQEQNKGSLLRPIIKIEIKIWFLQLFIWLIVVYMSKSILFGLQFALAIILQAISSFILSGLDDNPNLKLVIVMVLIPLCLNAFQFWMQDNFLKKQELSTIEQKYAFGDILNRIRNINQEQSCEDIESFICQKNPIDENPKL